MAAIEHGSYPSIRSTELIQLQVVCVCIMSCSMVSVVVPEIKCCQYGLGLGQVNVNKHMHEFPEHFFGSNNNREDI
jgi:hypothetical protein